MSDPQATHEAILADSLAAAGRRGLDGDDAREVAGIVTDALVPFALLDRELLRDVEPVTAFAASGTPRP